MHTKICIIDMISFGSDNHSGIDYRIMRAIEKANQQHDIAYGDDSYTARAEELFDELFGVKVATYFMFNGTGCNVTILKSITRSFHSIICADSAHINCDECGAPESHTGCKVIAISTPDGKLTPELVMPYLVGFGECHHSQPKVISISQTTERGGVYTQSEISALARLAHSHDMYLHLDGARIANGVVATGGDIRAITVEAGVDVLSFGGTKNGMMLGEAAIFFNRQLAENFKYERKQAMQLYSKMRFVAAQFCEYLNDGLWLELASKANSMASYFASRLEEIDCVTLTQKVEANALFVSIAKPLREALRERYFFYDWEPSRDEIRLMCSFDTTKEHIDEFINYINEIK